MGGKPLVAALLTALAIRWTFPPVEIDDNLPRKQNDALAALARQDLDPLSVDELHDRIATLEDEIARCHGRIDRAVNHRANADSIFKR